MRGAVAVVTVALELALAGPAVAQSGFWTQPAPPSSVRPGIGDDTPLVMRPRRGPGGRNEDGLHDGRHDDRRSSRRHGRRRHHILRVPTYPVYRDDREPPPAAPARPEPAKAAPSPEPAPPPDPRGPLRLTPARGIEPAAARWRVGEPLPPALPHVTLDWRRYGLPEPPAGRIYARVGRDVLLITAGERVVERVIPSG